MEVFKTAGACESLRKVILNKGNRKTQVVVTSLDSSYCRKEVG